MGAVVTCWFFTGCASTGARSGILTHAQWATRVEARGVNPDNVIYPFSSIPEMGEFARNATSGATSPLPRLARLQQSLFDSRTFPFEYDAPITLTPAESFSARRGNCLSFTVLFVTLARSLGLPVQLYSVQRLLGISKEESLVIVSRHVVAGFRHAGRLYVYDFSRLKEEFIGRHIPLDDVAVSGLFHTNIGASLLQKGQLEAAREQLFLATRLAPRFGGSWVNLGVVKRRLGDIEGAFSAYERALRVEPGNASALTNIAFLYAQQGREAESRAALAAAARGKSSPYSLIALADLEMARGNIKEARRLLGKARRVGRGHVPEVYEALARWAVKSGDRDRADRYRSKAATVRAKLN